MSTPTTHAQASGYVSEESKRTFTTVAGVLGALFFILQFALPMVAVFAMMPWMTMSMNFVTFDLERAAALGTDVYLVESKQVLQGERAPSTRTRLVRLGTEEIEPVAPLDGWEPHLLAGGERLWLISSDRVSILSGGRLEAMDVPEPLGDIAPPFLLGGRPAVVETRPEGSRLLTWTAEGWIRVAPLADEMKACCTQFLEVDGEVVEFRSKGSTLYARTLGDAEWDVVVSGPTRWRAFLRGSRPAVAVHEEARVLRVLELREGRWQVAMRARDDHRFLSELAAFEAEEGGIRTLSATFPGSLTLRTWRDSQLIAEQRFGRRSLFPSGMMAMMWLPHLGGPVMSLILAVILASLMHAHRLATYVHEGRTVRHASLTRRAVSQLVDAVIVLAPGAVSFVWFFETFSDPGAWFGSEWGPFGAFVYVAAGMAWAFLLFIVFSLTEGLWGATPGKWLTGIRVVGTDLRRCGVGRASVRNLLKLVDGFFNFMIGILMVAYTQDWQRLGDLAARTVVIRLPAEDGRRAATSGAVP